jgi:hypothetical protein
MQTKRHQNQQPLNQHVKLRELNTKRLKQENESLRSKSSSDSSTKTKQEKEFYFTTE